MKEINIPEEVASDISYVISMMTKKAKAFDSVEAVLLAAYEYNETEVLSLEFICNDLTCSNELLDAQEEYAQAIEDILEIGCSLRVRSIADYNSKRFTFSERRAMKDIVSSKILFDRNRFITKEANKCITNLHIAPYNNLIDFNPEIVLLDEPKVLTLNKQKRC